MAIGHVTIKVKPDFTPLIETLKQAGEAFQEFLDKFEQVASASESIHRDERADLFARTAKQKIEEIRSARS